MKNLLLFLALAVALSFASGCAFLCMKKDSHITIASYNIRVPVDKGDYTWKNRLPRIRKVIEQNKLDIFGIQEGLKFQIEDMIAGTNYGYTGVGRNDFQRSGEYSAILYDKTKFELLEFGTFGLSEKPDMPGVKSWGSAYPRIATWGLFRVRQTGKKFLYYNTHLDHVSELARVNGIRLIMDHVNKRKEVSLPVILTGDFNARPDSGVYKTASQYLKDAAKISVAKPQGPKGTYHGFKGKVLIYIDYIFVSNHVRVKSFKVDDTRIDGKYPSDHDPVVAELFL